MGVMRRPCLGCGRLSTTSRCPSCARQSPYQTQAWRALSFAVVQRDGACVQCGSTFMLAAHHVVPRAEGGPDTLWNLEAQCVRCHGRETAEEQRWP